MVREDSRFFFLLMLLFVFGILGYFTYHIIAPFLGPIAWAIVFSIVFSPVYMLALKWLKFESLASLATLVIILILILGPLSSFGYMLALELGELVQKLKQGPNLKSILSLPGVQLLYSRLEPILEANHIELHTLISQWLATLRAHLLQTISIGAQNVLKVILDFILMLLSTFFLLKDGPRLIVRVRDYLPFSERHKDRLIGQARDMIFSTIYGGLAVAAIQGMIAGLTFWALGVSMPVFWAAMTFLAAFAPFVGTAAIWLPGAVYLFLTGRTFKGLALLAAGIFFISILPDYFLRPMILKGKMKMNTLLILFSVFGGMEFFGIIGLVLGPLTLALFISVLEIFGKIEGGGHAKPGGIERIGPDKSGG
ncbi:MAG: AI-2E family transporter [Nitrospiraceae bacterium]|nr:AI-2E family transporter [Nitrospiraceae bacterium]